MKSTKDYFSDAGGMGLLKHYFINRVFITAIVQFFILGKSKTSLELLRLSVDLKKKRRFQKKYRSVLEKFDNCWVDHYSHIGRKTVWIFWWQGEEAMPSIVSQCYSSVREKMKDWEIVLLTKNNYTKYTKFPDFILNKLNKGITLTHFSDLLRLELLIRHGGLWLDATVLCTDGNLPQSILDSDLFMYRPQKPGADGRAITLSSWMIWAKSKNKILMATQTMLYNYWQSKESLDDYFLLHHFLSIVLDYYSEESEKIPPFCNSTPHILLLHLFDKYDVQYWKDLQVMCCFHKLSYKLDGEKRKIKGTYFDKLFNNI